MPCAYAGRQYQVVKHRRWFLFNVAYPRANYVAANVLGSPDIPWLRRKMGDFAVASVLINDDAHAREFAVEISEVFPEARITVVPALTRVPNQN